ncbi:DUF6132 family protein [Agathobaculum desmolans]|uniref:DUF6132 family protein n=1 Tax=Agathobaculum desmolans TaxID=39484 RepID=UPI00248D4FA4|nr:DUF6132 family protein [Agathobaculum desmolans]
MDLQWKKWLRPALFALAGAAAGWIYYHFFGCTNGCPITASPYRTSLYIAVIGWLIAQATKPEAG